MVNNRTETRHFRCNLLLDYINLFFTFLKIDILLSCVLSQMFIFNEYLMPFYLTSTIYISWMYGIMQRRPTKICRHFAVMYALVFYDNASRFTVMRKPSLCVYCFHFFPNTHIIYTLALFILVK